LCVALEVPAAARGAEVEHRGARLGARLVQVVAGVLGECAVEVEAGGERVVGCVCARVGGALVGSDARRV
jgi:hypothetical protein